MNNKKNFRKKKKNNEKKSAIMKKSSKNIDWNINDFKKLKNKLFLYRKIPKNTTLYHGGHVLKSVMNWERGFYLASLDTAKIYAEGRRGFITSFKTSHTLFLFEINKNNVKMLLEILDNLSKEKQHISVRKMGKLNLTLAKKVVQSFTGIGIDKLKTKKCVYKSKKKDEMLICTEGYDYDFTKTNF